MVPKGSSVQPKLEKAGCRAAISLILIKVSRPQTFLQNGPRPAGPLVWPEGQGSRNVVTAVATYQPLYADKANTFLKVWIFFRESRNFFLNCKIFSHNFYDDMQKLSGLQRLSIKQCLNAWEVFITLQSKVACRQ